MIPGWKLRREWHRLKQQLRTIPERITDPIAQAKHDAAFEEGFPVTDGQVPLTSKVAVLLVYQPDGLSDTVLWTCQHLFDQGFAPFIVTNQAFKREDTARLEGVCWKIMTRPNFGYDFGGYRDAILWLDRNGIEPDWLAILNDSVWFPLYSDCSFLSDLLANGHAIQGTNLRQRPPNIQFLESYFYLLRGDVVQSQAFKDYWASLKLTSNKYKVVRRCERGFSMHLLEAGFDLSPGFSQAKILDRLAALTKDELHAALRNAAYVQPESIADRANILANARATKDDLLAHFSRTKSRELFYSALPATVISLEKYPMLKRSNNRIAALTRGGVQAAIEAGDLAPFAAPVAQALELSDVLR